LLRRATFLIGWEISTATKSQSEPKIYDQHRSYSINLGKNIEESQGCRNMASKALKALKTEMTMAERLLWEKYNKPNRNLFQALSAFEGNGVGQKVVCIPYPSTIQL
jgi:hypothetical protein